MEETPESIKDVTAITAHMNAPRRWHGWETNIKSFPPGQPVPADARLEHLADDGPFPRLQQGLRQRTMALLVRFRHGRPRRLGCSTFWIPPTNSSNWDCPTRSTRCGSTAIRFFFPQASTLVFGLGARGNMLPVDVTWYEGEKNIPPVPEKAMEYPVDPNIPAPSTGQIQPAS